MQRAVSEIWTLVEAPLGGGQAGEGVEVGIRCVWGRFAQGKTGPEQAGGVPGTGLQVTCRWLSGGGFLQPPPETFAAGTP